MALLKTLARLDKLIWTLIFGGLLGVILGLSITRQDDGLGTIFIVAGVAMAIVGAVLILVRSRMTDPNQK